jgi:cyclopropane fatty-acyl-phospholipid synthase-like methyltransferase
MIATPYDSIAGEFAAARASLRADEVEYLSLLLERVAPGSVVLDLGCGTGHPIATHIAAQGHRIVGVDASASMLALARERLPAHRWIHGLIEQVAFDEQFDAVVCWDALFHVPRQHWSGILGRIHGWLRPGGRLMLSSGGVVQPGGTGFTDTMFGHEFFYDSLPPDVLLAELDRIGFDIVAAEMCEQPDGGRNRGKWATLASRRSDSDEHPRRARAGEVR